MSPGADLAALPVGKLKVREAAPSPAPGPVRDVLAAVADTRARTAEAELNTVLQSYLDRTIGVVRARLKGPKARKGTRWWSGDDSPLETKALDADYVVPVKVSDELRDDLATAAVHIATAAAADTAARLGAETDLGHVDEGEIAAAIEDIVTRLLGVADRHARELRKAVLDADGSADTLDEVFDRVEAAHRRGGNWVLMSGRTLANALANDSAYREAARLGVTHAQWISRRDTRVRPTHRHPEGADGQVRRLGDAFHVGAHRLRFPGDPSGLPATWEEVANCRCGLLFAKPDKKVTQALADIETAITDPASAARAHEVLLAAFAAASATPDGATITPAPAGDGLPPVAALLTLSHDIVAYRVLSATLDVVPGQVITAKAALSLTLAIPDGDAGTTLAVLIPAGVSVGVSGGVVIVPQGAELEVLGAGSDGIRTVLRSG